jgi:hypothetical protein
MFAFVAIGLKAYYPTWFQCNGMKATIIAVSIYLVLAAFWWIGESIYTGAFNHYWYGNPKGPYWSDWESI